MNKPTINVTGGNGHFVVEYDGTIVERCYTGTEYDGIESFVLTHTSIPYDFFALGDVDICYVGAMENGKYDPPATFEREGDGGEWEVHEPRTIDLPATRKITIFAESSVALKYEFEVHGDTTDEDIQQIADDVDGGDFIEEPNSGDWSQRWEEI